jgi:Uma2 family endonuclease
MPSDLPSGPVRYELYHGRLITLPPLDEIHGAVESNLVCELTIQGERKGFGKSRCGGVGIILGRNPDHAFGADAVFVTNERLPIQRSPEGYLETIPELVVEVRSKNDTRAALGRKAEDYLRAGGVVWGVDPYKREIAEYRNEVPVRI